VRNFFPQYARAEWLDHIGESFGITRLTAQKATGSVTVSGDNGTNIPLGAKFSTEVVLGQTTQAIVFEGTATAVVASGTAVVPVRAIIGGAAGNVTPGLVKRIVTSVPGLTSVTNPLAMSGGTSNEADEEFRTRFLFHIRNPIAGGNRQDYITWALEVSGVGDAQCIPLNRGAGTVDVFVLDEDLDPADGGLIATVQNYIAPLPADEGSGKAPIGADVLVLAPTIVSIDISVTFVPISGYVGGEVKTALEQALTEYITSLPISEDVLYVRIANVVHDTDGVLNYSSLTVNGGAADVPVSNSQKAQIDVLDVSE
jgi:uncharacterized phage protein gp47/JayE